MPADNFQLKKHFSTIFYGWGEFIFNDESFDESLYLQKISLTYNNNDGCEAIFPDVKDLMCMTMLSDKKGPSLVRIEYNYFAIHISRNLFDYYYRVTAEVV